MKKLFYLMVILVFTTILSCKKTVFELQSDSRQEVPITMQSTEKQVAYAEHYLKQVGSEIARLNNDESFTDFVRNEVRKKFDTEYEVLISDLKKNSSWANKLNSKLLNEGLNAFKNIGGNTENSFYPQIYIPKFQFEEDEQISNNSSNLTANNIIYYVFYGGDSDSDTATNLNVSYPGYIRNEAGELEFWGQISEYFANSNEVWVFSISESVNAEGRSILPCHDENGLIVPCLGMGGGGSGSGSGTSDPDADPVESFLPTHPTVGNPSFALVNCKVENMTVNVTYESWLAGKSEVSIKAQLTCHNNRKLGDLNAETKQYRSDQYSNRLGKLIRKFSRREVKNSTQIFVNYSLQQGWSSLNPLSDPIFFNYAIFERDNWPVGVREIYMGRRKDFLQNNMVESDYYATYYRAGAEPLPFGFSSNSLYSKGAITNTLGAFPNNGNFTSVPYNSGIKTMYFNNGLDIGISLDPILQPGNLIIFNTKSF